ncbi:MAG TPA: CPBP family glutamic-type intramembrane protease, partial [Gemmatimonadales bacterium]
MLILAAIALYVIWTLATFLLEGQKKTFLKPASSRDRLVYALVANLLIGTLSSILLIHWFAPDSVPPWPGFAPPRVLLSVTAGLVLGVVLLAIQRPPTWNPLVLVNGYAQTLVVSIAEVLVCWALLGAAVTLSTAGLGTTVSVIVGLLVASIAFGAYHFGHTAPFNTPQVVIGLSVVGLATGLFFVISGDIYGTIAFHNFSAVKGVTGSLSKQGLLEQFRRPQPALLVMAVVALA